ncbi:hypothetical protein JL720_4023 [Aureococcus anophagefferens]|nr:hypothetical protein JL720_4023 [Aureococcus anophagefferens]
MAAEHAVRRGCKAVFLLSRSGAVRAADAPLKRALDAEAATRGASVEVIPCDVCDGRRRAFAEKRGAEVAALFHCAGVARDGALRTRDAKSLAATADPKTGGALRLAAAVEAARAAAGLGPLAVDCAYSSVTALLGNAGQTDYGAANGGLDALAAFRKARVGGPRCSVAVQWGPWAGHGMASGAKNQGGGSEAAPFAPLLADEALNCLDFALAKSAALESGLAEVAVVRFDFDMLAKGAAAAPHLAATCAELGRGDAGDAAGLCPNVGDSADSDDDDEASSGDGPDPEAALAALRTRRTARRDVLEDLIARAERAEKPEAPAPVVAVPVAKKGKAPKAVEGRVDDRRREFLGMQIAFGGAVPVAWLERVAPARFKLVPKLWIFEAIAGCRVAEFLEVLLPYPEVVYPGCRAASSAADFDSVFAPNWDWYSHWTGQQFHPGLAWIATFTFELSVTVAVYFLLWCIGCHVASALAKWIVVGKMRAGVFPIWESGFGWRTALYVNGVQASFVQIWAFGWKGLERGGIYDLDESFVARDKLCRLFVAKAVPVLENYVAHLPGLVSVDDGAYVAAKVFTNPIRVDARRGLAFADGVSIGKGAFVGPLSILMPGAVLEDGAATGSSAVIDRRVARGRIAIGDGERPLTLAWRRSTATRAGPRVGLGPGQLVGHGRRRSGGPLGFDARAGVASRDLPGAAVDAVLAPPGAARVFYLIRSGKPGVAARLWLLALNALERNACLSILFTLCRVVLGAVADDGVQHPLRGSVHLRWALAMKLGKTPPIPDHFRFLWEYVNAYARLLGAKIAGSARCYPNTTFLRVIPEADVVSIGEGTVNSAHVYGHDFSNMHLRFKETSLGDDCHLADSLQCQILPGSQIPEGTVVNAAGRGVAFQGLVTEPGRTWSGNPFAAQATMRKAPKFAECV